VWIDQLQQAIADVLDAELPAKLLAIEAAYDDGIALERPAEIWPCDKAQVNAMPAVEVWCPDSTRTSPDETALDYNHRLTIVWTITGSDEVEIDKRIKRYILATIQVLDGRTFDADDRATPLVAGTCTYLVVDATENESVWLRVGAVEFNGGTFAQFTP
jgi:uncharacterized membrane-anchored protein